ncbi:MAG: DUF2007 domain-containing protein [Pseudomonadota bacterium]
MKKVYTHTDSILVGQVRSHLERSGIACVLRNEFASGAAGELSPLDTWPEVWVIRERDESRARQLIASLQTDGSENDWQCAHCGADNPGSFELCWQCGADSTPRPDE